MKPAPQPQRRWNRNAQASTVRGKIALAVTAIVAMVALLVSLWILGEKNRVPTDSETLCPLRAAPSEVVVLLLDLSDAFSEPLRLKIENHVQRLVTSVKRFGLIQVYAIDDHAKDVIRPVVTQCSPGDGSDLSPYYQNPAMAARKWQTFNRRVADEIQALISQAGAQSSPIMEAVQATALRTFNLSSYDHVPKRLVIVSDLLQNVAGRMNHHREVPRFDDFRTTPYFNEVRADLDKVEVTLLYLVRAPNTKPLPIHRLFWEQFFSAMGATVDRIDPVFGGR